jgi:hypothetical protein
MASLERRGRLDLDNDSELIVNSVDLVGDSFAHRTPSLVYCGSSGLDGVTKTQKSWKQDR